MKLWLLLFALLASPAFAETPTVDPTKNVLDTVNAQEKLQNMARDYEAKLRDVEMRRIKELGEQKEKYDLNLATILRANSEAATLLLATQLNKVEASFNDRMSKQEQFRFESVGKSSGANELWVIIGTALGLLIGAGGVAAGMRRRTVV